MVERRTLVTGWRLFAACLARHRPRVGHGRELGPLDPQSCDACWMVMLTLARNSIKVPCSGSQMSSSSTCHRLMSASPLMEPHRFPLLGRVYLRVGTLCLGP